MKLLARLAPFTLFAPMLAFAQDATDFTNFIAQLLAFINAAIPFVFALAFLVFIWGMFKAFILGGSDPEKQSEATPLDLRCYIALCDCWFCHHGFALGNCKSDHQCIRVQCICNRQYPTTP